MGAEASSKGRPVAPTVVAGTLDEALTPETGYGGPQVCAIVDISYRQLDYWARTELVRPSLSDARGSGTQRRYSYRDLVRLKVIKSLLDAGVKLQTARRAIEYLREDTASWETASLVLDGTDSVLARDGEQLIDLVRHGQGVLNIVPLGHVVQELDTRIHELAPPNGAAPRRTPRTRQAAEGG